MKLPFGSIPLLLIIFLGFSIPDEKDFKTKLNYPACIKQDTGKAPTYTPEKIILDSFKVLTITDTAYKMADIGRLLNKGYGELFDYIGRHNLKPGKVMAFYYTSTLPFVFDAAIEVNSIPAETAGKIQAKKIKGGDAIVVHYQGPYDNIGAAYDSIANWLKKNNKKAREHPFEVYINDPVTVKDPQLLRTDVYQQLQ